MEEVSNINTKGNKRKLPIPLAILITLIIIGIVGFYIVFNYLPHVVLKHIPYQALEYMPKSFNNYYLSELEPLDIYNLETKNVSIKKGWTTYSIAEYLASENIIKSNKAFLLYTLSLNKDVSLQAGEYRLSPSMTADEILEILSKGKIFVDTVRVTIPEGYELAQIKEKLVAVGIADRDKLEEALEKDYDYWFLKELDRTENRLEGYLFPDTYEIPRSYSEEDIVNRMLRRFEQIFNEQHRQKAKELGMTIDQVVTLASIVEREAVLDSERATISGVFHNRMNIGMLLQSCATVQYIIGERKPILTFDDIAIESPYNTYVNSGLPPGPIASPGAASINAALNPEKTDYLYFVAKKDGGHTFSKTLEEHERAAKKNLR